MPTGLYQHKEVSDETKKKISDTLKRRIENMSDDDRKKLQMSLSGKNNPMFGKKHSEETRKKMSVSHIGQKISQETKDKISKVVKGRKHTEYSKLKMSLAQTGRKHSEESKKKMSYSRKMLGIYGENHPMWKGGVSNEKYNLQDWTETLRNSIRERDNFTCQECEIHQDELNKKLAVHHIDYDKLNCDPKNLITLCTSCHSKTNYNREYWIEYFKDFLPTHNCE
jgi:hypothetical protein